MLTTPKRSRVLASLLVLATALGSCESCGPPGFCAFRDYPIDDALAVRISVVWPNGVSTTTVDGCALACDLLSGRSDAGPSDAAVRDAGQPPPPPPSYPVTACDLAGGAGLPREIRCYFGPRREAPWCPN